MSAAGTALVGALVALGMIVVLPLGLRLLRPGVVVRPRSLGWPLVGTAGAVSLVLPQGTGAALLAGVFALATGVLAGCGLRLGTQAARRSASRSAPRGSAPRLPTWSDGRVVATVVALVLPVVGAGALVAERAGWGLLGFSGTYLALTVPHMLYAGFGAALIAGLVAGLVHPGAGTATSSVSRAADAGAWGVPVGTLLVLVGYFTGEHVELAGAVVLTAALWATAWATARGPAVAAGPTARRLLVGGAVTVGASMLLVLWWAVGEAFDVSHPGLDLMAATHGLANATGYVLCTLLGLRLARDRARTSRGVAPSGTTRGTTP
ncbi:YndJ family transporter [Oerskovia flava]|uniref:YndJ family transporter n=1 Tax=Oerskovia flava TaxID=2986422 RepID=UPI002240C5AF|nr:YndJ family transporter [Oerskovia sp. JB1-3-2]